MAMEMIWDGRTKTEYEFRGDTEVGKIINSFSLDSENSKSNEYRVHFLKNIIKQYSNSNIASIGCGPVLEIRELMQENALKENKFHLFDYDQGAFEYDKKNYVVN